MTQETPFKGLTILNTDNLLAELIPAIHEAVEKKFQELYKEEDIWAKYSDFITVNVLAKQYFNKNPRTIIRWVKVGELPPTSYYGNDRGWQKDVIREYLEQNPRR